MRTVSLYVFIFCLLFVFAADAQTKKKPAQKKTTTTQKTTTKTKKPVKPKPVEVANTSTEDPEKRVKDIISFLEYLLNTLGDADTPARDKGVIVTESYSKIFRDGKVQIEDDLDESRQVITNKDVPAYLKDVDFFFKNAKFELLVEDVKKEERAGNQFFYKVTLTRRLTGTTSEGAAVSNSKPRYVEINYDPKDQNLKIVSIYTNAYDERYALQYWWNGLSHEWREIFKKKLQFQRDSLDLHQIKELASLVSLDLSGNAYIQNLHPLAQLAGLESLNISATPISDLSPLRNLTELRELNISSSRVPDLSALKFAGKMEKLMMRHTAVGDISVVQQMSKLRVLDVSDTRVIDISPLASLNSLEQLSLGSTPVANLAAIGSSSNLNQLHISRTSVTDLSALAGLKNLKTIRFDSTAVRDLGPLRGMENLEMIYMNSTSVTSLDPLLKLRKLQKIYCDKTPIKQSQADAFRLANPNVLVIFDSEDLSSWWNSLSVSWQEVIARAAGLPTSLQAGLRRSDAGQVGFRIAPSKEDLATLAKLDSINIEGVREISDLEPLSKFPMLRKVIAANTSISSLTPLRSNMELVYLDITGTGVKDLLPISSLSKLKMIKADYAKLENIYVVMPGLEKLYTDGTFVDDARAMVFLVRNPKCLLVYKTQRLKQWWGELPVSWKEIFRKQGGVKSDMTTEALHKLVEMRELEGNDEPVSDLTPLGEFIRLEVLSLRGTALTTATAPVNLNSLKTLRLTGSPLIGTESLAQFAELEELDISNTPVEDITPLWRLRNLKKLNCAGTQIKHLDALEKMESLEHFDCSNTNVNRLDALDYIPLKSFKCFNTRLSTRTVDRFRQSHPECTVVFY